LENIEKERHSSWLENFYDLIVAIVVFQLSTNLNHNVTAYGFLGFVALFIPVWWSWMGVTFYNSRFETDDLTHRLLTLSQIAAAAFMAVCVPGGLDKNSAGFAISYASIRGILVIEYLRTGRHVPSTHTIIRPYSIGFSIAAGIWLASAFVPPPFRYILWIVGLVIDIATPTLFTLRTSATFAPNIFHLPERFGIFTIIVLGISILAVVDGISNHHWTTPSILDAALGLGIAFSLWWTYFDSVDGSEVRAFYTQRKVGIYICWLYIHLPLLIGFTALGVAIEHSVLSYQYQPLPEADKWLMCISVALCLSALGIINITSEKTKFTPTVSVGRRFTMSLYALIAASIIIFIAIVEGGLLPVYLMSIMAAACGGQVILDIRRHPHHRLFRL
jgi:low temperature requirement protein LtrA